MMHHRSARWQFVEPSSRSTFIPEHDLLGKPATAFPDHAALDRGTRPFMGRRLQRGDVKRGRHFLDRHRKPPPPVRMLVDGTGNVGLVHHPEEILQRYRE